MLQTIFKNTKLFKELNLAERLGSGFVSKKNAIVTMHHFGIFNLLSSNINIHFLLTILRIFVMTLGVFVKRWRPLSLVAISVFYH